MEFSNYYSKMIENIRFIEVLDHLRNIGVLADYVEAATMLGTNKSGISDIKAGRKRISVELLQNMKKSHPSVSLDYIIMGSGRMFEEELQVPEPPNVELYKDLISAKDYLIRQQKDLIEQQKEIISRLNIELSNRGQTAFDVGDDTIAHVG